MGLTNFPDGINVGSLQVGGVAAADIAGITATAAEVNKNAGVTAGTVTASKTLVAGASKDLDTLDLGVLKVGGVVKTNVVIGPAAGYKVARGEDALDGSNPTPIATGLTSVIAFVATLKGSAAPGVGTSVLTAVISGATANVYGWKPTSNADPTLVASTGTETFYWIAIGT